MERAYPTSDPTVLRYRDITERDLHYVAVWIFDFDVDLKEGACRKAACPGE